MSTNNKKNKGTSGNNMANNDNEEEVIEAKKAAAAAQKRREAELEAQRVMAQTSEGRRVAAEAREQESIGPRAGGYTPSRNDRFGTALPGPTATQANSNEKFREELRQILRDSREPIRDPREIMPSGLTRWQEGRLEVAKREKFLRELNRRHQENQEWKRRHGYFRRKNRKTRRKLRKSRKSTRKH